MAEVLQQIAAGVVNGCLYALLALALVMIYRATHHVNFAQGEMALFAAYVGLALLQAGAGYWLAFAGAVAFGFVAGMKGRTRSAAASAGPVRRHGVRRAAGHDPQRRLAHFRTREP
jgi:branched-subunit amino acid ABC-type transport system permease component